MPSPAGEGVAFEYQRVDAQRPSHAPHFVLEKEAQRFDDAQVHLFGKSAHVVVRLDGRRRAVHRHGFDDIRIDGSLCQPLDVFDGFRFRVEDLDEVAADDFAFRFGVGDAAQVAQKLLPGLYSLDVEPHVTVGASTSVNSFLRSRPVSTKMQ